MTEIGFQLLNPIDQGQGHVAGTLTSDIAGAEGHDVIEKAAAHRGLHLGGGDMSDHRAPMFGQAAGQNDAADGQCRPGQLRQGVAGENPPDQPAQQGEARDTQSGRQ